MHLQPKFSWRGAPRKGASNACTCPLAVADEHPVHAPDQAELFRLEGLFHVALGDGDAADRAFSTALTLWPQLAAAWLSWGEFCDSKVGQHAQKPLAILLGVESGSTAGRRLAVLGRVLRLQGGGCCLLPGQVLHKGICATLCLTCRFSLPLSPCDKAGEMLIACISGVRLRKERCRLFLCRRVPGSRVYLQGV